MNNIAEVTPKKGRKKPHTIDSWVDTLFDQHMATITPAKPKRQASKEQVIRFEQAQDHYYSPVRDPVRECATAEPRNRRKLYKTLMLCD